MNRRQVGMFALLSCVVAQNAVCPPAQRLTPFPRSKCVIDVPSKLMLCSAPKAGKVATVALMVAHTNKTREMEKWLAEQNMTTGVSTRMLTFWKHVALQSPDHKMPSHSDAAKLCASQGWLCLVLVRNPLDRALSSFFHVAATLLCDRWPELHAVVGDAAKVRAANYTFRQHVQALSLMPHHGSGTQPFSKGGWGVGHVLPQYSACLKPFFGGADQGEKIYTNAPPYKLLTIDDLPRSLAAADAAFRGSRLGIGQLAVGLHSAHWRSDPGAVAAFARAHRTAFEVAGPGVNRAAMLAAIRAHNAAGVDAHADVFASALCGHPGGLPVPRKLSEQARGSTQICLPAPGTYRAMQATNRALWARVRCLFADDFALYHRSVCEQPWLRTLCEGCVARACGPAGLPLLY